MKMVLSKKVKIVALAALALIICAIAGFAFFKTKAPAESPKKIVHTISYSWPYVDLDTAVEEATYIVYGRVTDISKPQLHEVIASDGEPFREYHRHVTVEVISQLKGENTDSTVLFREMAGESDDEIYIVEGCKNVALDDEILLFASEHGTYLSPATLIPVVDGVIDPIEQMRPENISSMRSGEINVFDYLDAVENKLGTE